MVLFITAMSSVSTAGQKRLCWGLSRSEKTSSSWSKASWDQKMWMPISPMRVLVEPHLWRCLESNLRLWQPSKTRPKGSIHFALSYCEQGQGSLGRFNAWVQIADTYGYGKSARWALMDNNGTRIWKSSGLPCLSERLWRSRRSLYRSGPVGRFWGITERRYLIRHEMTRPSTRSWTQQHLLKIRCYMCSFFSTTVSIDDAKHLPYRWARWETRTTSSVVIRWCW